MKIDEPKTPYVPHYDPDEEDDDEGLGGIDTGDLAVDELDLYKGGKGGRGKHHEEDIPDLELGEPDQVISESAMAGDADRISRARSLSQGSAGSSGKHVVVGGGGGENRERASSRGSTGSDKHHDFEEKRKKHYEMPGLKSLLG